MNTLEWAVMTLPCLWICAAYVNDAVAAGLVACGLAGRVGYAVAYARELGLGERRASRWRYLAPWGCRRRRRALELAGVLTMKIKTLIVLATLGGALPGQAAQPLPGLGADGGWPDGLGHLVRRLHGGTVPGGLFEAGARRRHHRRRPLRLPKAAASARWPTACRPRPGRRRPSPTRSGRALNPALRLGLIDPPEGLADDRVWMLGGGADRTVEPPVMDALEAFYRQWVPADALRRVSLLDAGHAMISVADGKPNACNTSEPPHINRCGDFDAPGELLRHLLGKLEAARAPEPARSRPSTSALSISGMAAGRRQHGGAGLRLCAVGSAGPAAAGCMWPSTAASRVRTRSAGASWKAPATTPGPAPTG